MSLVLRMPERDLDLGPTFEGLAAFGEMGRLEPGDQYRHLMGVPQITMDDAKVDRVSAVRIRQEAAAFRAVHGPKLEPHALWILEQLESDA